MTSMAAADRFDAVFGSRRSAGAVAQLQSGRRETASDELRRLMKQVVAGDFEEALRTVRALGGPTQSSPPSKADMLAMNLGTWLAEHTDDGQLTDIGAVLGWGERSNSFGSGLKSRLAHRMENDILDCPPGDALAWARRRQQANLPIVLAGRLAKDGQYCAEQFFEHNPPGDVNTGALCDPAAWAGVVEAALSDGDVDTRRAQARTALTAILAG